MEKEIVITLVIKGSENVVDSVKRDVIQVASENLVSCNVSELPKIESINHEKKCNVIKVPCCFKQIIDDGK